eukprot:257712-Heterocapsa_arctica.AAC.1
MDDMSDKNEGNVQKLRLTDIGIVSGVTHAEESEEHLQTRSLVLPMSIAYHSRQLLLEKAIK